MVEHDAIQLRNAANDLRRVLLHSGELDRELVNEHYHHLVAIVAHQLAGYVGECIDGTLVQRRWKACAQSITAATQLSARNVPL
jgi:hypothetical protein